MIMGILLTIAFLAFTCVLTINRRMIDEKAILRDANEKLERIHKSDDLLTKRYHKTIRIQGNALRDVMTECHGVIGAGINLNDGKDPGYECSLESILTECHAAIGNNVSICFDTLRASEQQHYAKVRYPGQQKAPWSELSALQAKHATEKNLRKANNKPGFDKFTIDEEPFKPADIVSVVNEVDSPGEHK